MLKAVLALTLTNATLLMIGCAPAAGAPPEAPTAQSAATTAAQPTPHKHKIVYHLTEPTQAKMVMANVQNTITGFGGMANFEALEIVVHGPALKSFLSDTMEPDLKESVEKLVAQGVTLTLCGNTITKMNIDKSKLFSGCNIATQGGVVRLIELQEKGYAYMRP